MFRIGVISDTHGFFEPRVAEIFQGADHILHAGDVGRASVLDELRALAPVTAVQGNVDGPELGLRLTEFVELAGCGFLLHHIVNPHSLGEDLLGRIARHQPALVVFGHSHRQCYQVVRGVCFFNPGYAGQPRFNAPRSVAILECTGNAPQAQFHAL
jgi:uncharacterized protein